MAGGFFSGNNPDNVAKINKLLDQPPDNDDVQNVWHNWDMPAEEDED